MFERLTESARRVVQLSEGEARDLGHAWLGTEHLLLGLLAEGEAVAAQVLARLSIDEAEARAVVIEMTADQPKLEVPVHIPFTPRAKKVLELSLREGLQLGHNYIGTEHILLALIREGEGIAAQVLVKLGADLAVTRQTVIEVLSGYARPKRPDVTVQFTAEEASTLLDYVSLLETHHGPFAEHHPVVILRNAINREQAT